MKSKLSFVGVCFFLVFNTSLTAQMKRVIKDLSGTIPGNMLHISPLPNNPTSCTVDTIILTTQAQVDNFTVNYPTCTTPKYLFIDGTGANPAITNLAGLSSLTQVINKLIISHTSLTDLSALSNLTQIGDTLQVEHNALMTSIGLNNLTLLGAIILRDLPVLTTMAGLSNNITTTGLIKIDSTALTNLDGLGGIVNITTENGGLSIENTPITSLSSLINLSTMQGYLRLDNDPALTSIGLNTLTSTWGFLFGNTPNLTSIAGISNNLTNTAIGTFYMINTGLTNLSGMDSITAASNFYISVNQNLTSLLGLEKLSGNIGGGLSIYGNPLLPNISALSNITSINDGTVEIAYNGALTDLTGFGNITTIGNGLWIYQNPGITSLNFLDSSLLIQNNNLDSVRITDNNQLALCSFAPLCNYLSGGGGAIIHDNASGCSSIAELVASCGACIGGLKTWTGTIDTDWGNAGNWSPAGVPVPCDTVYIPTGLANYPGANSNITIHGLIMEESSSLSLGNFSLTNNGIVILDEAEITGYNDILFVNATDPHIFYSTLVAPNTTITGYTGSLTLFDNTINGNLILTDSTGRLGTNDINANSILGGDLTITTNSTAATAETFISNSALNYVTGNVTFNINTPVLFSAAGLHIGTDLNLNSNIPPQYIILDVIFNGGMESHIRQLGTTPVTIRSLYTEKNSPQAYIIPEQDVFIGNNVSFLEGIIKTTPAKLIIFNDNAGVSQNSSASYIWGPVKKTGNDAFQFPTGDSLYQAVIRMSAPGSSTDAFTAQYFHINPTTAGYDTSLHVSSLTSVSGSEYWVLNRDNGNSNVRITLHYDSTRSNKVTSLYSLRDSRWNGSEWLNTGVSSFTGNLAQAFVTSRDTLSAFGTLTLGYVVPPVIPAITVNNMDSVACSGGFSFKVRFTVDTLMYSNNNFIAQLSDSTGSFSSPVNIGSLFGVNKSDSINALIPSNTPVSGGYRVRIIGTSPPDTSINSKPLSVKTYPLVSFTILGPDPGCISSGIHTYYASQKEPGVNYQWLLSGGGTFTSNQDTAYVTWTAPGTYSLGLYTSNQCGTGPSAGRQITVGYPAPTATPTINNTGRWLYASQVPPSANYQWYRNGTLISGAVNASYYASLGGDYTLKFTTTCGAGPISNTISFAANSIPQTITFPVIPNKTYGDAPFIPNATTTSGLPVSFIVVSGPANINFQTNLLTITGTGLVTVTANQPGDNIYDTAAPVTRSFTVNKASQIISFPAIANQTFGNPPVILSATASSGLSITYAVVSGPATVAGNYLTLTGLGTVLVRASQNGDTNYLAATPVDINFCTNVASLNPISGYSNLCPSVATYTVNNIPGATYFWRIAGVGTLASTTNTTNVNWTIPGTYSLLVSASGNCGAASANDTLNVTVINSIQPDSVQSMFPPNGAIDQQLPLTLSWIPAHPNNFYTFDLYVWRADTAQPSTPYAANLTAVNYTLPVSSGLLSNQVYNWMVVSHNGSCTPINTGPIQQFTLLPLADLVVQNVQAPATAFSGQTISINWTVKNSGTGNTSTNQNWTDAVFLSFDTIPNFSLPPNTTPVAWNWLEFPVRTLLLGTKPNVSALNSGQQYSNSMNFTLPLNYSQPMYVYVITNYPAGTNAPQQVTYVNDTARAPQPVIVTLSPTPDLRVDTVFAPSTTFSGSTVNLTYKVKNYGVLTQAGAVWTDKVYISQSPFFDINNAIPIKLPKSNGTYYADAVDAAFMNNTQLLPDSVYTRTAQVVIPNYIFGTYFLYVFTNATNTLYEGALSNNNTNRTQVQVFLTPTPHLTVSSLTLPVTIASTTQPIGVNWNIANAGFNDNIEKNKGYYFLPNGTCAILNPPAPGIAVRDSISFGSSYWIDRAYLSTDPTGLNTTNAILVNETAHGVFNSGLFIEDGPFPDACQPLGTDPAQLNMNTLNVIRPGADYPAANGFVVPDDLTPGDYYVYLLTNATHTVYEYPGTPETRRSALPISIQRPDATVPVVTVPATAVGGQTIAVNYSIVNNGPGAVYNHARKDKIYISTAPVFNGTAQLISTQTYTEDLPVSIAVPHTINYTIPVSTSGTRYFYVHTNYDSAFKETNPNNNISTAATISLSPATANDLVVSTIQLADSVFTIYPTYIMYTVLNNGIGTTAGVWTDSIFISCSSTFSSATSYYVTTRNHGEIVPGGGSYTDSFNVGIPFSFTINNCFPPTSINTAYFYIKTNADNVVYEGTNWNNNVTGTGSRVLINPLIDLIVTTVTGPDTATVARPYPTNWAVKNIGYNPGASYYGSWFDAIYVSPDSTFNNNAVEASHFFESAVLNTNQIYSDSKTATVPNVPTGDYYVFVKTDYQAYISGEKVINNNTNLIRNGAGAAKKIHVIRPLLPDLTDSIVSAPSTVATGQPVTLVNRVSNKGAGVTYPSNWSDDVWLSSDFIPGNAGDKLLSAKNHVGTLQPNQFYNDTSTANIPLNIIPGNYVLISRVNATGNVFESNSDNNLGFKYITIYSPAPSDLVVENIMKPDSVFLGYTLDTAQWVIKNIAVNAAVGISSDGIYLSQNSTLDSTAVLLGIKNKTINMGPLATDTISLVPLINNVTEGNYNVIVKTDLLNNIAESDKDNNTGIAVTQLYVKVKALPMNTLTPNTLFTTSRFYKLIIPDSLSGATILVTLKSGDSLTMKNQLFIGKDYVPSAAHFDYAYNTPNYGNQDIVMTSAAAGIYYITIRCVSASPVNQNITLKAVKLPFAILTVQTNSGGNIGNVTIRISGSLFTNNMTAKLSKPGTVIDASAVYFSNSTTVFATFNLQGKPLGIYDVTLTKPDSSMAILVNGFSVVNANNGGINNGGGNNTGPGDGNAPGCDPGAAGGINSQLVVEMVAPDAVFIGWPFIIQINYNNPTNVDIPAQVRTLYSELDIKMALTPEGVANGTTALYLELVEPGGPPGIIRAGGSGTITVYAKSPVTIPQHTFVLFSLK